MNSLLRTIIRPGIYNANMGIYNSEVVTVGSQMGATGLCLLIKKGTTFVFSNDYKNGSGPSSLGYRRNFNHVDESYQGITPDENFCLIKSVALSDVRVYLGSEYSDGVYSIHAYIHYNPVSDAGETDTPMFFLVKEKNDSSSILYQIASFSRYSSSQKSQDVRINEGENLVLDGLSSSSDSQNTFYLNVGFIEMKSGSVISFTGRGLPEYRYSASLDSYRMSPDIIPNMVDKSANNGDTWNTLYFDIPESFVETSVVKSLLEADGNNYTDSNWEGAYFDKRRYTGHITNKVSFSEEGTYAVYGTTSTIRSFPESSSASIINDIGLSFGAEKLSNNITITPSSSLGDIPLDVSPMNVYSLLNGIQGKDIWSYVIEKVRESLTSSESFNNETDIIPIALVTVDAIEIGIDENDNPIYEYKINHEKTLCYFGLQERLGKINILNVKEHNFFNVIPVME